MKVKTIISLAKKLELDLHIPEHVFKPSFMTREVLRAVGQVGSLPLNAKILDLGTGSGIIGLTLYKAGYQNIYVSEKLESTMEAAKVNFKKYHFEPKEIFISDLFQNIPMKFDLIITNPPAYPYNNRLALNKGMDCAVYSGRDGREFMTAFLKAVTHHLNPGGRFLMSLPSFLDWQYVDNLLRANKLEFRDITSERCQLPTYGYPKRQFIENFNHVFSHNYYLDGNPSQKHYWPNLKGQIEFRVKTVCGRVNHKINEEPGHLFR